MNASSVNATSGQRSGGREIAGRALGALGGLLLAVSGVVHCFVAYPRLTLALRASNLAPELSSGLRAVFLLVGWDQFVFAAVALLMCLRPGKQRRAALVFVGAVVLVQTAITLRFSGLFIGNELIGSAAVLLLAGGLLLPE